MPIPADTVAMSSLTNASTAHKHETKPTLPVVNVGSRGTPTYLPAGVYQVQPGQNVNTKLSPG